MTLSAGFSTLASFRTHALLLLACVVWSSCALGAAGQRNPRPFTVRDSIELGRVLLPSGSSASGTEALVSPDGSRFLIYTRHGDLARNVNRESLLVFTMRDIERYLDAKTAGMRPAPRATVAVDVDDDTGAISDLRWIGNDEFAFIAEGANQRNQLFIARADTGRVRQLTHSATHVASYAIAGDRIVYYARVETPIPQVVPVVEQSLFQLLSWDADLSLAPLRLLQASRSSEETRAIDLPDARLMHKNIWISPSGTYAVTLVPATDAPALWAEYRFPNQQMFGYAPEKVRSDPTSWDLLDRTRFFLVDLRNNAGRALLNAPSGWLARSCTPLEVIWSADDASVVVSNTFLPLDGEEGESRARRASAPAVAHIDVGRRNARPIAYVPTCWGDRKDDAEALDPVAGIRWNGDKTSVEITRQSKNRELRRERYEPTNGNWRAADVAVPDAIRAPKIFLKQGLNERPRLYASGGLCGCAKELLDPSPGAEQLTFGPAKVFRWKDRNDTEWQGGLITPPDHVDGERYPLVVQTHGFRSDEFLIDGPFGVTTALAAQALSNAGFVVLQVEDNPRADTAEEARLYADGYRAGIEKLGETGMIDLDRVGLIAFSRTGLPTIQLLADHPDLLLAVTIADAGWWGYLLDLALLNYPQDLAAQARELTGGSPSASTLPQWIAGNPVYRLPQTKTAVRIEANGSVLTHWEHYAILKNANRPVDLIYFPHGSHILMKPAERLASQQGTVDWFRFWLKGEMDDDGEKRGQYARWCRLPEPRTEHHISLDQRGGATTFMRQRRASCVRALEYWKAGS